MPLILGHICELLLTYKYETESRLKQIEYVQGDRHNNKNQHCLVSVFFCFSLT